MKDLDQTIKGNLRVLLQKWATTRFPRPDSLSFYDTLFTFALLEPASPYPYVKHWSDGLVFRDRHSELTRELYNIGQQHLENGIRQATNSDAIKEQIYALTSQVGTNFDEFRG